MLGSKEIRDFTPEKAVFGGYDARSVEHDAGSGGG